MESLDDVSIYVKYLKEHSEGFHHVAYKFEYFNEVVKFFKLRVI